ncbi:odorant receptor 9a-like isoform X1 [Temnothorax longispinosus]|uniref:odorant receptor 9a-like isoform X1 n=1 Tax=Temnothorax longispinosus TaxID=300112 RepID=UPI003A99D5FC
MANERWKDDVSYAMTPFKLLTWPIGVWPLQVYNIYSLLRCIFATCCVSLVVILSFIELYMGCTDADQSVDSLMLISSGILGVLKIVWFRVYARGLTNNYGSAVDDYLMIENTNQRAIMRKHAFMGRFVCCFMLGFSYFGCIVFVLIPLLGDNINNQINVSNEDAVLDYPMPSRCALEYLHVPTSMYRISCLIETISLILGGNANQGTDCTFLNITLHVCGQVEILKAKFLEFDVTTPKVYERFIALIKRHSYLIRMARQLADTVNFVLLIQLFIISIQLCIMGEYIFYHLLFRKTRSYIMMNPLISVADFQFILALKVNDVVMAGKSVIVQSTFLLQLTLYSFIGDYLKSQMEEIGLSIYQNAWYNFPADLTKNLVFIIMRTQSPVMLQAGHFIVINLSTYMSILRASISYLSVLRVMVET